jgi:hypothetical protein
MRRRTQRLHAAVTTGTEPLPIAATQWTLIRHVHALLLRLKIRDKRPAYQQIQPQPQGRA